ncbi:sensor histidine kinase [Yinghuangia sp. YIM S09857]|uniref:sensor histidine kinase n=1 Tax=Yinghuangia sp. YIM S09857 TaxID=3436929 RepID=UPI003F53E15E
MIPSSSRSGPSGTDPAAGRATGTAPGASGTSGTKSGTASGQAGPAGKPSRRTADAPPPLFGPPLPPPFRRIPRDLLLTLAIAAFQIGGTFAAAHNQRHESGLRDLDPLAIVLVAIGPLLLLVRRRYPVQVLVASVLPPLVYTLFEYPPGPVFVSLIVALFTAMTMGHRAVSYAVLLAGYATIAWLGPLIRDNDIPNLAWAGGVAAWLLVLAAFSEVVRVRRAYVAAERRREAEEEAAREEAERARAGEERLRIARELHDVLAHHISLMNVQASVGLELMDANPEQARTALTAVKQASREALGELRGVLAILKGEDEAAPRTPTAGLADLDDLVTRASTAHLAVRLERDDAVRALPGPVGLAAYRIVQESVTNAVRHSGATVVTVRLTVQHTAEGEALRVAVEDDGRGSGAASTASPAAGGGHGLRNMRERATALGGSLTSGTRPEGGYRVVALLPLAGQDGADSAADPAPGTGGSRRTEGDDA